MRLSVDLDRRCGEFMQATRDCRVTAHSIGLSLRRDRKQRYRDSRTLWSSPATVVKHKVRRKRATKTCSAKAWMPGSLTPRAADDLIELCDYATGDNGAERLLWSKMPTQESRSWSARPLPAISPTDHRSVDLWRNACEEAALLAPTVFSRWTSSEQQRGGSSSRQSANRTDGVPIRRYPEAHTHVSMATFGQERKCSEHAESGLSRRPSQRRGAFGCERCAWY